MPAETEPVGTVSMGWSMIKDGDVVLGARDGAQWQVDGTPTDQPDGSRLVNLVKLDEQAVRHKNIRVRGVVRRVATGAQMRERALAIVQVKLGGEVVAVADDGDERGHACPAVFTDAGHLAAHLLLFHATTTTKNVDGSESTYSQVDGEHRALHHDIAAGNPKPGTVTHWHDPNFDKRSFS